jgi:hypothetical protein
MTALPVRKPVSEAGLELAPSPCGALWLRLNGRPVQLRSSGALWSAAERTLVVADLHLEKGSAFAARGQLLPPYDTRATLQRLAAEAGVLKPERIVLLGDSFHDGLGPRRLDVDDLSRITSLSVTSQLIWITGNHDAQGLDMLPGEIADEAAVQAVHEVDALALHFVAGGQVAEIGDGRGLVAQRDGERRALMDGGKKRGAVFAHAAGLDGNERGQVLILRAEPVADPRAHRRTHFRKGAGVELQRRARVLRVVGVHAPQQAEIVRHPGKVRHQVGNHHAGLAARFHRRHGPEREILFRADLRDLGSQRRINFLAVS